MKNPFTCCFIGYGVDGLGYRLWDMDNQKLIRSRDVIFNEKCLYKDRLQVKEEDSKYVIHYDVDEHSKTKVQENLQ